MKHSHIPFDQEWNFRLISIPIMLFFTVALIWSALSEVDEVVRGEGRVIPSGQTKVLQHLEGGIVHKIFVKEGDIVKKGAPIYQLSQAFFLSDQNEKKIELLALLAQEIRLEAEIKEHNTVQFPTELQKEIPHIVHNEARHFELDKQTFVAAQAELQDQLDKTRLELIELQNKQNNIATELAIAQENVTIQENLVRQGASSRKEYLAELAKKQSLVTQSESIKNRIPVLQESIQEAQQKLASFQSRQHSQQLEELTKVRITINKLQEKDRANRDRETRKMIISPVYGRINKLYFHTVGGIIKPGDTVAEITPADTSLMIEARIKTSDRARIWEKQKATIEITAYESSRYGLLDGTLTYISPDSSIDPQTRQNYYTVHVTTDQNSFGPNEPILPGMVANVNILTGKKTILEYILKPIKDIKHNAMREH